MICPRCGRDADYGSEYCPFCGAGMGMQRSEPNHVNRENLPATLQMSEAKSAHVSDDAAKDTTNMRFIFGIAGASVIAIAGALIAVLAVLGVFGPQKPPIEDTAATERHSSITRVETAVESEDEDDGYISGAVPVPRDFGSTRINTPSSSLAEGDVYRLLTDYYDLAGKYDNRASSCANDFNNYCYAESKQTRNSKASTASSLKRDIKGSWDDLSEAEVPFWSKNYDNWLDLVECYECLWHRIDVIDAAWSISLKYDKPADHKDEILAPILADRVNGDNKYYTRFNELYPNIHIQKP